MHKMGKEIHWELCKELKFDHPNKWHLQNPEFFQENQTHKFPWDFEIQTDNLVSTRRPDLLIINKKKISTRTLLGNWKKNVEHESDGDTNCNWSSWYSHQRIGKRTWGIGNKKTSEDHPNYSNIKLNVNKICTYTKLN